MARGRTIVVWVVSVLLAALYVFAGVPKLIGTQQVIEGFARAGYPGWFRIVVGLVEVAAGLALLVPRLAFYAAGILGVVMIGAVFTSVRLGELGAGIVIPIICLALLAAVAHQRRGEAH